MRDYNGNNLMPIKKEFNLETVLSDENMENFQLKILAYRILLD